MCLGYLGWAPRDFWRSNVWEIATAMDGFLQSKGVKQKNTPKEVKKLAHLKAMLDKEKQREKRRNDRAQRISRKDNC